MNEEHKKIQTQTDFYTKAQVERRPVTDRELIEFCNFNLKRLGSMLEPSRHYEHLGSIATHIFKPKTLEGYAYVHQNALSGVEELVASKGLEDLKGTLMESFGRRRQKRRSGF